MKAVLYAYYVVALNCFFLVFGPFVYVCTN